ncbi:Ribose-phosphate pyrophosphokinase 3, chloroplastic,Ribose-phosphate pyrophosphokinase 3, mitochondrial,Ribose-phosphate pyrophosphokinase 4 [Mytilus coruscus]|uniref:Ribose-phosphate pyrophosphokinase 3, chloroplastic,Ribose-phosphate pyrophosphokinase 3, mitochondrial,Ribose-phosphate pyrophosphokinase 4 n=1 Tax=Mytilus coruscus TaxID=42192 RepID=A0A6J8BQV9_MYTCO|nr:Ribose-phosphate pyrophosphokinase 3, chloroplastic,Ribose-phosphate pyrophosphokinase 3, mitochondrial,Ribose-phosphate pyrophosphokinase 4 [Mytilus coruscus]
MNNDDSPVLLYAHPSMYLLAEEIVNMCTRLSNECSQSSQTDTPSVSKRSIERTFSLSGNGLRAVKFRKTIQWKKFQDGFPNLFIEDVKYMAGKDVIFIGSFHTPELIFEQLSVLYSFPRYLAKSFHFILPYFPTGTMERVDTEGQIATAKTLATLISAIPLTAKGPAQICIFDIHALQERFYFSDNIIPRLESAVPLLLREVDRMADKNNIAYAFPDDGACKRFHHFFGDDNPITCVKIRDGTKRIVKVKDGNPENKHVIIVDDLVQTGGTLKECGKALLEKGAKSVSAYVTHPVFPNDSWKRFVDSDVKFENFWITDSIPHAREICNHPPFKLLSLCEPIAEMLMGYDLMPCR